MYGYILYIYIYIYILSNQVSILYALFFYSLCPSVMEGMNLPERWFIFNHSLLWRFTENRDRWRHRFRTSIIIIQVVIADASNTGIEPVNLLQSLPRSYEYPYSRSYLLFLVWYLTPTDFNLIWSPYHHLHNPACSYYESEVFTVVQNSRTRPYFP